GERERRARGPPPAPPSAFGPERSRFSPPPMTSLGRERGGEKGKDHGSAQSFPSAPNSSFPILAELCATDPSASEAWRSPSCEVLAEASPNAGAMKYRTASPWACSRPSCRIKTGDFDKPLRSLAASSALVAAMGRFG